MHGYEYKYPVLCLLGVACIKKNPFVCHMVVLLPRGYFWLGCYMILPVRSSGCGDVYLSSLHTSVGT